MLITYKSISYISVNVNKYQLKTIKALGTINVQYAI